MGAIIRRAGELQAAAPLFHRIKGIERGFRVLGAPAGVSRRYGLARVAISLGFPPSARAPEMVAALADAHRQTPLPPRRIADGPCKENKLLGADVDLWRLPAPLIHPGDGGRYLNTWGTVIVQTPDRRWTNWSISRIMVTGKNTMVGLVLPQQHLGMIFAEWQALQQPMPFALAMGTAPAIPFVSGMPLEANVDEAGFLGGYLGEPVEVVDCETVAPPGSRHVGDCRGRHGVAGRDASRRADGRIHRLPCSRQAAPNPVFHVSAMTFRNEPILPVVAAGEPIEENHTCWSLAISAQILWELRNRGLPVSMCFCPFESAVHWLVVTVNCSGTGVELARSVGEAVFGSRCGNFIPQIILLEDDIDPSNLAEVVWAFATRSPSGARSGAVPGPGHVAAGGVSQ